MNKIGEAHINIQILFEYKTYSDKFEYYYLNIQICLHHFRGCGCFHVRKYFCKTDIIVVILVLCVVCLTRAVICISLH